jgi:hypothetical protein
MRVANGVEEFHCDWSRTPRLIDQKQFLLGANAPHAGFDHAALDHELERLHVMQQRRNESPLLPRVLFSLHFLRAHNEKEMSKKETRGLPANSCCL